MAQYVTQLCEALAHVLERAVTFKRHRLAGYVANLDFWVAELSHRLHLLDGWKGRRENMIAVTEASLVQDIQATWSTAHLSLEDFDTSTDWDSLEDEIERLRARLRAAAKRFIRRSYEEGLIEHQTLLDLEDRFQFRV